jgi:SNF2 family DNA or RNA helicase/uncharacterized Zn finger protein
VARQSYGVSPWGRWFMDVLESYGVGERLGRGKSYANTNKVLDLEIKERTVKAKIKGHYQPFYRVQIEFPPLDDSTEIENIIRENPALLSSILQGTLPEDFLQTLKQHEINLIPEKWTQMKKSCNCPDSATTCKHIAALYFVLSREIDANPYLLFSLRSIDLKKLANSYGTDIEFTLQEPFGINAKKANALNYKMPENTIIDFEEIPNCTNFITALLPQSPAFCSETDFTLRLSEFYHNAARYNPWVSFASNTEEQTASRSNWKIECKKPAPLSDITILQETVQGKTIKHSVYDLYLDFCNFSFADGTQSYRFLFYLFKYINLIIQAQAYAPYPVLKDSELKIIWLALKCITDIKNKLNSISLLECNLLLLNKKTNSWADSSTVVDLLSSTILTEHVKRISFIPENASINVRELSNMFFLSDTVDVSAPARRSIPLAIGRWLTVLNIDFNLYKYCITLKEQKTKKQETEDVVKPVSFKISVDIFFKEKYIPLNSAVKTIGTIDVLKAPTALSNYLPEIKNLFVKKDMLLQEDRFIAFLDEASDLLSRLGIQIVFPKILHRELKPRLVLKADKKGKGGNLVSYLDLPSLLNFNWQIAIGDSVLSEKEFLTLVKQKKSIVNFKNKFIRLDPQELANLFKAAELQKNRPTDASQFLRSYFQGDSILSFDAESIVRDLFAEKNYSAPPALKADLRSYQLRGYNWICTLLYSGFGCILADDMGLGKTIQAIAVILRLKEEGLLTNKCLIVAPAALLENWYGELTKFAPNLNVGIYHGKLRSLEKKADVFLTTYQTLIRDIKIIADFAFSFLILDEAHLIKNAETRASKTVKGIHSRFKLALSGTPIENRLEDMRSLFDFVLPGYLGSQKEFQDEFRMAIEVKHNKGKAEELRKITAPFLMRRLKTDKNIISDLPEKITTNDYSVLGKEQAALYESVIQNNLEKLENSEGKDRSAMLLTLLTALKQICDHPRVYDKESPAISKLSGKATQLLTILDELLSNNEKVLIFSQYVETLECLSQIIINEAGEPVLLYNGALSQEKRSQSVNAFQNDSAYKIMLVSLKAGGLGLNLTAASNVVHYDLWYNPAVEAQATDRAFRIGQKRNVFVHRFITKNSFEEKIDAIISSKKELSEMTVQTGESWISRLSKEELRNIFSRK